MNHRTGDNRIRAILTCIASAVLTAAAAAQTSRPAASQPAADYLRFLEQADGSAQLQTVLVHMAGPADVTVDLVGAVHIADAAFFEDLNRRFKAYDAVLYELVGSPTKGNPLGNRAVVADKRLAWIATLQDKLKNALRLQAQLEQIDYTAPNFVHADMDAKTFRDTQAKNNESFWSLWQKAAAAPTTRPSEELTLAGLIQLLTSPDSANDLKRTFGREFDQMESLMSGIDANGTSVIVGERNRVALEVLTTEVQAGKKHLAIFYGTGHLPDMERRLTTMGYHRAGDEWLTAWRIDPTKAAVSKTAATLPAER